MTFLEFVAVIPDSLWGVLFGSLLTLLGLMLSNQQQNKRLEAQLHHQASESTAERHFGVRSRLYINAFAEIGRATRYLTNLSDIDPTSSEWRNGLDPFFDSLQKAALVSSDATNRAVSSYLGSFSKAYFRLLPLVSPVHDARTNRDVNARKQKYYQDEVERALSAITHFNESGNDDQAVWTVLNENFSTAQQLRQEASLAMSAAWSEFNQLGLDFRKEVMKELSTLAPLTVEATVCIRSELNIDTDIDAFRELSQERLEDALTAFDEFVNRVENGK